MAIEKIPSIVATASSGGVVYSIDFQMGFSNEASKVTYRVVNSSGQYSLPSIDSPASIAFGDFKFDGYVYSYELEESNSGNVLSVTLIDKSVILDKLYVCVFRRGLFGYNGNKESATVEVEFDEDDAYYVIEQDSSGAFKIKKKNYTNGSVKRTVYSGSRKIGDILVVGREDTPDTDCEIPSSSYTFSQLKGLVSVSGFSSCPINDDTIKKTYEGTLRSVLNSWCQDFGISFYWDYSSNTLKFFDLKSGVFSIPKNVKDPKITSKKTFSSAEGKYNQVAVDYFARPFNPKTANASISKTFYSTSSLSCYNLNYFIDRSLEDSGSSIYGGNRSMQDFIISAALGYVSPALRKIYNFSWVANWSGQVGVTGGQGIAVNKLAVAMRNAGFGDAVKDMISYSGYSENNLDGAYWAILCNYDEGTEEAWTNMEQEIFTSKIGNFYRCSYNKSGGSVFCTPKMIVRTSVTYEPEGSIMEDNDSMLDQKLVGRRVFSRGAPGPEIPGVKALESLGLSDTGGGMPSSGETLQKLIPLQIELLSESKLATALQDQGLSIGNFDTLLIIPQPGLVSQKIGFSASYASGSNKKETIVSDIVNSQQNEEPECELEDPNEGRCLSAKEELKSRQMKQAEANQNFETKKPFSGLSSRGYCIGANIKTSGGSVKILSSSQSSYQSVTTFSYSVEAIADVSELQTIKSNVSGGTSSSENIIETRLIVENRTTAENLQKENLSPADLSSRQGYYQSNNLEKVSYTCAGFVESLSLGVTSGLESLDMSISDSGFSASYSYSTRPPIFANQDLLRVKNYSDSSFPALQVRS